MKQSYYPAQHFQTMEWANGTTTELVKYPINSDFLKRDFIFRISTATVDAEESTFSDFSGLTRILMVLEGSMTLIHDGRYQKQLNTYDQDTFDGSWMTRSIGKVRDFNLMFNMQAVGSIRVISLEDSQQVSISATHKRIILFVHIGRFECFGQLMNAGDVLDIESINCKEIDLKCLLSGSMIISEIELV